MKTATFIQRLLAYFIDFIIVMLISSIIASSFSNKKIESLENDLSSLITSYTNGEITTEEYMEETQNLTYEIEKKSVAVNMVMLISSIGYYIIFQFLNKGQTIGKKVLKLKVVDRNNNIPTIKQFMIRTSITNQIIPTLIIIVSILFLSKNDFNTIYYLTMIILYTFIIITSIMVLYRNDKLGIHDILSKTKVVKEGMKNE